MYRVDKLPTKIEDIPDEIMDEIFNIDSLRLPYPQWGGMRHPVLQVCQKWQERAMACRHLWTLFRFIGSEIDQRRRVKLFREELEPWLKRSGNSLLDISIEGLSYIRSCPPAEQWDVVLEPLLKTAHRWRSCHLDAPLHPLTPLIVELCPTMDHLTSLSINGGDLGKDPTHSIVLPCLKELKVAGDSSTRCLRLKCPIVRSLTLEGAFISSSRLQTLTEDMPNLYALTLKHCMGPSMEQSATITIFPLLQNLALVLSGMRAYNGYAESRKSFLNMLHLVRAIPCLSTLDCVLEDFHPKYVYSAILGVANPNLRHLHLHITRSRNIQSQADLKYIKEDTLSNRQFGDLFVEHLRRCTDLETLIIEGDRLIGPFSPPYPLHPVLDFLSSPQGVLACPKLVKIAFANLVVEDEHIVAFIRNRWLYDTRKLELSCIKPAFFLDHEEVRVPRTSLSENTCT